MKHKKSICIIRLLC